MPAQKHHDTIVAWAKGEPIQYRQHHSGRWVDAPDPAWIDDYEYRVKPPEPERVYPVTKMNLNELYDAYRCGRTDGDFIWNSGGCEALANAALRHACDAGQVVSREEFDRAVSDIEEHDWSLVLRTLEVVRNLDGVKGNSVFEYHFRRINITRIIDEVREAAK